MKRIDLALISIALILQLTGCAGSQTVHSEAASGIVSSSTAVSVQAAVRSSRIPASSTDEMPMEISSESTEDASQSQEQAVSSAAQSAVSLEPPSSPEAMLPLESSTSTSLPEETNMKNAVIEVGNKRFSVTLADNEAAKAFAAYLPMTVQMSEMNGQEKFYGLPDNLPANSTERPSTIRSGEIFCWSGNTLVLFYSTFQNSYGGYVRLGTVEDTTGLAAALGSGNIEVTWSLTE